MEMASILLLFLFGARMQVGPRARSSRIVQGRCCLWSGIL